LQAVVRPVAKERYPIEIGPNQVPSGLVIL